MHSNSGTDGDPLQAFSEPTRAWFGSAFAAPTPAQAQAWDAIGRGEHTLVVAPTGSGKTLAAFLAALDRLATTPPPDDPTRRCRVLYVSPLKALAVDVERNLRSPLAGIRQAASRLGLPQPDIDVAMRSGDTPAEQRRAFARKPADILITTPESLFLLLTSQAREALRGVDTVIVDEVHAVCASKRGAHLALSLERLDALLEQPAQRIGLSATVRPIEEVATFLAGGRAVTIVNPPAGKTIELQVVVPVEDMSALGEETGELSGAAAGAQQRSSIWPAVDEKVLDLIEAHRSTIVFANSRRLAERLTSRLNELAYERQTGEELEAGAPPAELMAQSATGVGAPPLIARAHHGSVSREQRLLIEDDLKSGRLPAVVATSSLELGIDMGAVDLVIQVEAPPSVASGLQRVGRAGHQVGASSRGVVFPKYRGDLVQCTVVAERMHAGAIEAIGFPRNPLDVLAQQIVAMVSLEDWGLDELAAVVRRAAPFAGLPGSALESVLDMLSGRYPSDEFAELRPRLTWERVTGRLSGRRGAQRLAVTSGGTIPDRGLFGVFLAGEPGESGRRVGELDEEMVYESRVGDVFCLGTSSWRVEEITHDRVIVSPAPGQPGRLPFWKGDAPGRPLELGRAVGAFLRELATQDEASSRQRLAAIGLDEWAAANVLAYVGEQKAATRHVPDDRTVLVERFRDELGDWRLVVHSPFGAPVNAPWAQAISARMRERYGVDVSAVHSDDGIVARLPDTESEPPSGDLVVFDPDEIEGLVTAEVGGSALFAARFRECAARALLLPKRDPRRRSPLWQQRQRAAQLLQVAREYGSFPIILETMRECLQDVFDLPGLVEIMRDVHARRVKLVEVETPQASPFAQSLLFGYIGAFHYEGDNPLAERRAQALTLDTGLLAELLGQAELRELATRDEASSRQRLAAIGLDEWAAGNVLAYVGEQKAATRHVPDDRTVLVERFRDELGDWRLVVHSPFGAPVNAPWAQAISARMRERYGVDVSAVHSDDGIVARLPDTESEPPSGDLVIFDPDEIEGLVTAEVGGSALFAARFRECAARALLLPKRDPRRRSPLWQQRQRAAQLLQVAREYGSFPIILETMRECLQDVFDLPGLVEIMRDVHSRRVKLVEVETLQASPFAQSLLFGYIGAFLYEGDNPLAERRAQALTLDTGLLAELLGRAELRELLDPDALAEIEAQLQRLTEDRKAFDLDSTADLLRLLGDLRTDEALPRGATPAGLAELEETRRALRVRIAGEERWIAIEDAGRVRDALGAALPVGVPEAFTEPVRDPLGDLIGRYARTHGPFRSAAVAARLGLGVAVVEQTLQRLTAAGRIIAGEFRPGGSGPEWCDAEVLRTIRRRSLARLRGEIEPVEPAVLARFLPAWQRVGPHAGRGYDALLRAIEQLAGALVPASALETLILPARIENYSPSLLDELMTAGEVRWCGAGSLPGRDGWIALAPVEVADALLPVPEEPEDPLQLAILAALRDDAALFFRNLSDRVYADPDLGSPDDAELTAAIWDLVWAGQLTNDTLAPLRATLGAGRTSHGQRRRAPRGRYGRVGRPVLPSRTGPPIVAGRWSRLPAPMTEPTARAHALAETMLDRY
ncbi:MAG TPA: DEAD/DEAH box helicase, partial [Mycobacteriales bacterium]|nr:DEAD/DEAH box helicase [Mycobacteriales bacterium]